MTQPKTEGAVAVGSGAVLRSISSYLKNLSRLGIVSHLAGDNLKCASNPLMCADKPAKKSDDINDEGYDANDIDQ
jgi:hypothetical protein